MNVEHKIKSISDEEFAEILKRTRSYHGQQDACRLVRYLNLSLAEVVRIRAKDVTVEGIQLPRYSVQWHDDSEAEIDLKLRLLKRVAEAEPDERLFESTKPFFEGIWDLQNSFIAGNKDWQDYQRLEAKDIPVRLPNFLVLGTPKSATTWLHTCLSAHPDVFIPDRKELDFWGTHRYYRGINWYKKHFVKWQNQKIGGEVSVSYFASPTAPQQISQNLNTQPGSVKLIVLLREPISRALSLYSHWLVKGEAPRTFEEALKISFFRKQFLKNSHYYRSYKNYLKYFNKEQILIILFEEIKQNPLAALSKVFDFLEVQPDYYSKIFDRKVNVGRTPKNLNLHYFYYHTGVFCKQILPYKGTGDKINTLLQRLNQRINVSQTPLKPEITPQIYQQLRDEFRSSNKRLAELAGIDLSLWQT